MDKEWSNSPSNLHQGKTKGQYLKQQRSEANEKKHEVAKKMKKGRNPHFSHEVEAAKNRLNQSYFSRQHPEGD